MDVRQKPLASLEGILFNRFKDASPKYRRAILIVLRSNRKFYGSSGGSYARSKGPGFMFTQWQYNGAWM